MSPIFESVAGLNAIRVLMPLYKLLPGYNGVICHGNTLATWSRLQCELVG